MTSYRQLLYEHDDMGMKKFSEHFHRTVKKSLIISLLFLVSYFTGSMVAFAGTTKLPYGQIPVLLYNGEITLQTQSGKLATMLLATHTHVFNENPTELGPDEVKSISYSLTNI